ncbi:alpha/beta hydrolase [Novosphingobium sp.]|uniref:alpha/beta hydrolase n=1 Tax=Novosphingobium sp. TaxID=1874826 RepID=UPI0026325523|nr:alpha/beta hydrolase [Novosphingobium sp.]
MTISRRDLHRIILGAGAMALVPGLARSSLALGAETAGSDPLALVDPELRAAARAMLAQKFPPMSREALPAIRAGWAPPPLLKAPEVLMRTIPGPAGAPPVAIELIVPGPAGKPRPAILHIHGGGMISGRARNLTSFCQALATEFDAVVVNVDYRLSPETPFPGPVLDNYAALTWMAANAQSLGIDPARIAVMGESAGGGLAAMTALMARDRGEVPLCQVVLIYPMLDDRTGSTRTVPPHIGTVGWSAEANRFGWSAFLGVPAGSDSVPTGSVPARESNLAGLAPTFIGVGALDLFVDEDIAFGQRLITAGVKTRIHVTPAAWHAFDFVVPEARVSREFTAAWKAELRAAFST